MAISVRDHSLSAFHQIHSRQTMALGIWTVVRPKAFRWEQITEDVGKVLVSEITCKSIFGREIIHGFGFARKSFAPLLRFNK